ncbi:alpha-aminoadipate reductase [Eremomyces bilateralis CBS 781.70]|uniref:Alpha-aminoadipate reductase n=1 Tax=Eremomyces bilateralis CBS 781.70 TaxID=1392243 RepID=A0A6G1G9U0_9PEZI|nr:alpha-aminoadipate reductase [Eremomyces bilateralis CBS 781.70]KAF1814762.1 alpha-aminoadipate reductase [Eremomyces bilateralis CBS 781.70]
MSSTTNGSVLPDPTADLKWSDFRGAIQDIFAENAAKFPERLCVVETASNTSTRREFTYQQIFQASCQLAHKLVSDGIERGDVVMIFAYRGVDLVVCIMGTLMAGATFSVLDPLYPPDRQQIYLEVSRPRALVTIERTIDEAGQLSDLVRTYVDNELELKTEVPALRLLDDGTLLGGKVNGADCLEQYTSRKAEYPGVVVGPDSIPTLSFTSGSEGKPKGVQGRHFSLAYYFDWMSEQFNLTENDRFTMLSGIAHDPIQRDIFTPLFLGARIVVPAKEDIEYEKLAAWMNREETTVTHLTPAMGQILIGGSNAQQFPSLHHAFFVGDILIKRDCRRLQELAPNVHIVNLFGTTETQRAVSFFEIPSRNADPKYLDTLGDVIPVGQGMKDVQLLIVDRENKDRLCDVGETGEIYVRAGGLAEGYLGLEDLTKQKFVDNWFVDPKKWVVEDEERVKALSQPEPWRQFYKGPRDRMYKSGDLGRRRADGNVECTGRADNQIKIRGFRIELGEIDAHVTSHPLVRENVTLLRRDPNEEPQLVSYIVPDMKRWEAWAKEQDKGRSLEVQASEDSMVDRLRRFRQLRDDVRDHLKTKLPVYAVPTVIVPLYRMPLNPNGKIDRPALPFPEPHELAHSMPRRTSHTTAAMSTTERTLAKIWSQALRTPVNVIGPESDFADLGGHSNLGQQMLWRVRKEWSVDLRLPAIFQFPTLRGLAGEIDRALDPVGLRLDTAESPSGPGSQDIDYAADAEELKSGLPKKFETAQLDLTKPQTVLLTGATGFLGAFLLGDLLQRKNIEKVICHVRAKSEHIGQSRVIENCRVYGLWQEDWSSRIECVTGDLAAPNLGISPDKWTQLADQVDIIIHNGARVHWVIGYSNLKPPNVLSTVSLLQLCATAKPKHLGFVSSTSVLDTDYYIGLSDGILSAGGRGVAEKDELHGSKRRLTTGYGQSKWASECLIREAGRRGLAGCIIRPGYVTGHPTSGMTITDDFLVRLLKGCVQVACRPHIENTINQVPVTHVARVAVAATMNPPVAPLGVAQVTSHPRLRFDEFVGALETYGYVVPEVAYEEWRTAVQGYVEGAEAAEEFALLPLLDMVTSDMPEGTKAPELDDTNAERALRADERWTGEDWSKGGAVTVETVGVYLAYLVAIGFMPAPSESGRALPRIALTKEQKEGLARAGGRGTKPQPL